MILYIKPILTIIMAYFLLFFSCHEDENYPIIPEIEFIDIQKSADTNGATIYNLQFSFTDGDGDIGLFEEDTIAPFEYNLIVNYYNAANGEKIPMDSIHYRIPPIWETEGKPIKGEIQIALNTLKFITPYYDAVRIKAYIFDRQMHQSNIIETPAVMLN